MARTGKGGAGAGAGWPSGATAAPPDAARVQAAATGAALLCVTHDHDLLPRFDRVVDFADLKAAA